MSLSDALVSAASTLGAFNSAANLLTNPLSMLGLGNAFFGSLRPASWRGVPFGVTSTRLSLKRNNAVHNYPYVDGVYVEDMGGDGKRVHIQGFVVEGGGAYGGMGTLAAQVQQLEAAAGKGGNGTLIQPLRGLNASMALESLEISTDLEHGRVAMLEFSFIENSATPSTSILADTDALVQDAVTSALSSLASDLEDSLLGATGLQLAALVAPAQSYLAATLQIAAWATSVVNMVAALPGAFGRFAGQNVSSGTKAQNSGATVQSLIGTGAAAMTAVSDACSAAAVAVENGAAETIPGTTAAAIAELAAANPDPAQGIQSMLTVIAACPSTSPAQNPSAGVVNGLTDYVRRVAATYAAQVAAQYQPTSYEDAAAMRTTVCDALDAEIIVAGDAGLDASYNALQAARVAVARDLTARGASLRHMMQVTSPAPVSSLVWAQKLYQDAGRESELVQDANPIHPAFMPVTFTALAA